MLDDALGVELLTNHLETCVLGLGSRIVKFNAV